MWHVQDLRAAVAAESVASPSHLIHAPGHIVADSGVETSHGAAVKLPSFGWARQ